MLVAMPLRRLPPPHLHLHFREQTLGDRRHILADPLGEKLVQLLTANSPVRLRSPVGSARYRYELVDVRVGTYGGTTAGLGDYWHTKKEMSRGQWYIPVRYSGEARPAL